MRCDEFDGYAAGWLEGERQPEAANHLRGCTQCSARMADLEAIVTAAASLPELDPPERVWTSLRNDLEREGLLRGRKSALERLRALIPAAPRTALATGLISALAALLLFLPQSRVGEIGRNGRDISGGWSFARVHEQLASGEARADQDIHFRDPQVAASYQQNLALVDNLIGECQKRVEEDPNDELSRQYLVTAYQQKADLLNALSEREAMGD
jgi:anti-sigma factor RsiW